MPETITIDAPKCAGTQRSVAAYISDYLCQKYRKHFYGFDFYYDKTGTQITVLRIRWED